MKELKEAAQAVNPALEPGQEINEADGEPIFHADEEEGADHEQVGQGVPGRRARGQQVQPEPGGQDLL